MTDVDLRSFQSLSPASHASAVSGTSVYNNPQKPWQNGDTASFKDLLAIINPLQHIPDRKSTRLNSSHVSESRMPSSA